MRRAATSRVAAALAIAAVSSAIVVACNTDPGCVVGSVSACSCADGKAGTQSCGAGYVYSPCKCGGGDTPNSTAPGPPPVASYDDAGASGDAPENPVRPRGPSGEVDVPAGLFTMGCAGGVETGCRDNAKPEHEVTLAAYKIDKAEVSAGEYKACVDAGKCAAPSPGPDCHYDPAARADFPVDCVSWSDAKAYCAFAGKRLPTEAEWERAARGDDKRPYPWGLDTPTCDLANFFGVRGCKSRAIDVVGVRSGGASPVGALDLSGNVWEWVEDFYGAGYYASSPATDPKGPSSGGEHVIRGGSFGSGTASLQSSYREAAAGAAGDIGFRCAK